MTNRKSVMPRKITRFREEQIKRVGAFFDWTREVDTTHPDYDKWTQWIFTRLYNSKLRREYKRRWY
jgi:leucyl-tRNA synthetase